jgi:nicotinate-nucleotide adenylyltransferase
MKVGLFFGSFNPIHIGHLIIANLVKESTYVKEVWFVVTPQNPHKSNKSLLHEFDRLDMVNRAISDTYGFRASDIEFHLPKPNYTIDTLVYLQNQHTEIEFRLIIGGDNLTSFTKWKNHDKIIEHFGLVVYPRPNSTLPKALINLKNVDVIDAPEIDISASLIRRLVKTGKSIKYLVPDEVETMIRNKGFYL